MNVKTDALRRATGTGAGTSRASGRRKPDYEQLARDHELAHAEREHYGRLLADLPHGAQAVPAEVPDPLEPGAISKPLRAVRDDPLAGMLARGIITQDLYAAGRKWQQYYEQSEIGGARAIDPTKEAVDGGRMPEMLTERHMEASDAIEAARQALGWRGSELVRYILGQRMSVAQVCAMWGLVGERGVNYTSRLFRDHLDTLAVLWGFRTEHNWRS